MIPICGKDYKCKKNHRNGHCSYTKGKVYHSMRDGYINDDYGASWSCSNSFFMEYFNQKPILL